MPDTPEMKLRSYGNTDIGRMRRRNEDAFLHDPAGQLFAVADGLGGLSAGDRASKLAISILRKRQEEAARTGEALDFRRIFGEAHRAVQELGAEADAVRGAGTTLTVALVQENEVRIGHAGDSAAYLFSGDEWRKLTTDHTEAEEFRKMRPGEKVPSIFEHTLTRCLGQPGDFEPDLFNASFASGDRLLLCTDGVLRGVEPEEIAARCGEYADPRAMVDQLIALANERGGADNATAVAVFFD